MDHSTEDGVPGSRLQLGPDLVVAAIRVVNKQMEDNSLCGLSLSLRNSVIQIINYITLIIKLY